MKPRLLFTARLSFPLATAIAALFAAQSAQAATLYWDTNGTGTAGSGAATGTWGTSSFWSTDATGANVGSPVLTPTTSNLDDLFFSAGTNGTAGTVTVSGTQSAHSITFDDAVALTLSGGTAINLGSATAGSGLFFTGNAANTISTGIILNSAATAVAISNSTASLQTVGAITGSATTGTQVLTVGSSSSGGITLNSIGDGAAGGKLALTVNSSGAGLVTLSGTNSYTGTTTISAGTLSIASTITDGSAVMGNGGITLSQGATLSFNPTANGSQLVSSAITLSGGAGTASIKLSGNDKKVTFSGNVTGEAGVTQTLALTQGAAVTSGDRSNILFSGVIANGSGGTLGLSIDFAGASGTGQSTLVNLSGQNTFTGPIVVTNTKGLLSNGSTTGGFFVIGGERTAAGTAATPGSGYIGGGNYTNTITLATGTILNYASSAAQTLGGVISGGGSLLKEGGGTLTLSAANTFTGTSTVSAGKVVMTNALALQNSAYNTTGSTGAIGLDVSGGLSSGTLTLGGLSGSVALATAITGYTSVTNLTLNPQGIQSNTYSGIIANGSGNMALTKTGTGTQILSGANTYTGAVSVNAGVLNIQNATALGTTAAGTSVATGAALQIQGGITVGAEALTLNGSGINGFDGALRSISGNNTYGGLITLGSTARISSDTAGNALTLSNVGTITGATFGLTVGGAGNTTISGDIATTTGGLTKEDGGTLTLTGTNTYTGNTLVNAGTLQVTNQVSLYNNGAAAAWSKTNINVGNGATMAFNVGGSGQFTKANIQSLLGLSDANTNGFNNGAILGLDTTGGSLLFDSAIANPNSGNNVLSLTKLGTNTLTLDQANTYTGGTLISAGTLQIGNGSSTGSLSTSSAIQNNATLTFTRTNIVTQGTDFANNIIGTGALIQNGAGGTLVLSSANTFTGTTTVSAGNMTLSHALALQNSALDTTGAGTIALSGVTTLTLGGLNGATGNLATIITSGYTGTVTALTLNPNSGSVTYGGVIANGGMNLIKTGAGTQILSGANTYTGLTTINRGILTIGNGTTGSLNGTTGTALTFTGTGTFNVAEAASSTQGMGALTLSAGDATITSTGIASQTSTLTFASLAARSAGATANFTLATNATATQNKIVLTSTANAPVNNSGSNNQGIFFGGTEYARYDTTAGYFRAVTYGTDLNASAIVATGTTLGINDATKDVKISGAITAQTTAAVNTLNLVANTLTLSSTAQVLSVNGIISTGATIATTGSTITSAGKIQSAVAGGELVINTASGTLNLVAIIQDNTSASSLTKSGTGQLTLSNSRSTYTGGTVVNAGTVGFTADQGANTDTYFGSGPVTFNLGTTLALNRTYVGNNLTLNNATVTSGNSFGATLAGSAITLTGTSTITVSGNLTISGNMTGTGGFIKTGAANVSVTGNNNYTGATVISGGALTFSKAAALYNSTTASWTASNITVASGATLNLNYGGASDFSNAQVTTLLSQLSTGLAYNGLLAGSAIGFDTTNGSGTYSGTISNSTGAGGGSVGLYKYGANTLTLSGNNTFSGPISIIGGGTLSVASLNSVNGGSPLLASSSLGRPTTVANGTITFGILSSNQSAGLTYTGSGETTDRVLRMALGGGTMTLDQSGTGLLKFTSALVNVTGAARTLTLQGSTAGTGEFAGALSDASVTATLGITKSGTSTWALSGLLGYTGATTINGGTLELNGAATFTNGVYANTIANAGTLKINSTANVALNGVISGAGALIKDNTGTLVLNGINTYSGATTISAGTLQIGAAGSLGSGTYSQTITNSGTLQYSSSAAQTLSGAISGSGALIKDTSTSTLTLSNASSSFTGNINITNGTLLAIGSVGGNNPTTGSLGNAQTVNRTITIGTGATLSFGNNDILGDLSSNALVKIIVNGGTINNTGAFFNTLGAVDLNAGTITSVGGASPDQPSFHLGGIVTVGGSAASTISGSGDNSQMTLGIPNGVDGNGDNTSTTFNVANATNSSAIDLNVSAALANGFFTVNGLIKTGVGTMSLTGTNTYTGTTAVNAGTLLVNGSISASSLTTVASGATVGGSGTIGALTVSSGGFINPGNSPGTLTVSGNYTQAGLYTAEITGLTAGTQHDQISVTGAVDITGGSLTAAFTAGSYAANNLIFILLNDGVDGITGTYAGLAQGATVTNYGGFDWQISYVANSGTSNFLTGNDIALMAVNPIPEPKAVLLGCLGMLLLLRRRR